MSCKKIFRNPVMAFRVKRILTRDYKAFRTTMLPTAICFPPLKTTTKTYGFPTSDTGNPEVAGSAGGQRNVMTRPHMELSRAGSQQLGGGSHGKATSALGPARGYAVRQESSGSIQSLRIAVVRRISEISGEPLNVHNPRIRDLASGYLL